MSSGLLLPTAYFVTPKGKQLAKSNSTGITVNDLATDYQKVTLSVGVKNGAYGCKLVTNITTTYAWYFTTVSYPPKWVASYTTTTSYSSTDLYGALTPSTITIDNAIANILAMYWWDQLTEKRGIGGAYLFLDNYVGDHIHVIYQGEIIMFTISWGGLSSNTATGKTFCYIANSRGGTFSCRGITTLYPTGNIDLYFSRTSYKEWRNPEAALPSSLSGGGVAVFVSA